MPRDMTEGLHRRSWMVVRQVDADQQDRTLSDSTERGPGVHWG
jgi:hypothetical protein